MRRGSLFQASRQLSSAARLSTAPRTEESFSQLTDGGDADLGEARSRWRADAPHQCDGQLVKELEFSVWIDDDQSIRLRNLRCDLARCLVRATPIDIGASSSRAREPEPSVRSLPARPKEMRAPCHVGEGLVDGDALDGRREIADDSDGSVAEPLVFVEMSADKHEVGTELPRASSRHAASYAEGPRLQGRRENHAAADRNRLAAQARSSSCSTDA